jgi:hypothetical protein
MVPICARVNTVTGYITVTSIQHGYSMLTSCCHCRLCAMCCTLQRVAESTAARAGRERELRAANDRLRELEQVSAAVNNTQNNTVYY